MDVWARLKLFIFEDVEDVIGGKKNATSHLLILTLLKCINLYYMP
jgi:hypothetical protein